MRFDEREIVDADGNTVTQQACVRLIGSPGYYRRCRARMSWPEFCARNSIPYTPNPPRPREDVEGTPAADANDEGQQTPPPPRPWANRSQAPLRGALRGGNRGGNHRGNQAPPRGRGAGGYVDRRTQPRMEEA